MKGTIKKKSEVEDLFRNGNRISGRSVVLIFKDSDQRGEKGRVAFIAGKKLGTAPQRNYAKRVLRHVSRENGFPLTDKDVIFVAKRQILNMPFSQVNNEVERLLARMGRQQKR